VVLVLALGIGATTAMFTVLHQVVLRPLVLGDFFGVLGTTPAAGRTLRPEDDVPGAARVVMVSHGLWVRRWGGDPAAVGGTLTIRGVPFTVVGVLPEGFDYPRGADVWTPTIPAVPGWSADDPPGMELDLVARLAPGATPEQVALEMERFFREDPELAGAYGPDVAAVVRTLPEVVLGDVRPTVLLLFLGALLVLGVALFNVTNLVFVRAAGRETSLAVRRALGADLARPIREALAEGALLAALAGIAGGVLAVAALAPCPP